MSAKLIPTPNTNEQEWKHDSFKEDPDILNRLVTINETWVYFYESETKQLLMEWKYHSSQGPKKFQVKKSGGEVFALQSNFTFSKFQDTESVKTQIHHLHNMSKDHAVLYHQMKML